jgi:hypothetical protein
MLQIFSVLCGIHTCLFVTGYAREEELCEYLNPKKRQKSIENVSSLLPKTKAVYSTYLLSNIHVSIRRDIICHCHN